MVFENFGLRGWNYAHPDVDGLRWGDCVYEHSRSTVVFVIRGRDNSVLEMSLVYYYIFEILAWVFKGIYGHLC